MQARKAFHFGTLVSDDTMSRTILFAKSAIGTLIVIDMCHIICHRNSLYRTVLFTFFTADTAFVTGIHSSLTFILRAAAYFYCLLVRNQLDQMMRTDSHTLTAGFTFFFIYMGDAVDDTDRVKITRLYTGTVAETSMMTFFPVSYTHLTLPTTSRV